MPSSFNQFKGRVKTFIDDKKFKISGKDLGVHVLTYHGLIEERKEPRLQRNLHTIEEFRNQLTAIKQSGSKVFSPQEFERLVLQDGLESVKKGFLITFDDGYQNNLLAMELLDENGFDAVFFITTGAIDSQTSIWTVNLSLLILNGSLKQLKFKEKIYPLTSFQDRNLCLNEIGAHLKKVDASTRASDFNQILEQFKNGELQDLVAKHPEFKMLSWDEINNIKSERFMFQGHGVTHELFHDSQTEGFIDSELRDSKAEIEQQVGEPVNWFAYANGDDFHPSIADKMAENNFKLGFSLGQRPVINSANPFFIPRYNARQHAVQFLF